jgi:GntR family transcriptional repressor for pyruvate dehydrogenase complex
MNATRARLLLEPEIAKYVAEKASPENIERICDVLAFQNFHRAIVVATANPYLVDLFDRIFDDEILPEGTTLIPPYLQKDTHEQIEAQHRKIAEAIRERNGEFAYFYMKEHTLFIHSIYQEHFERFA